MGTFVAVPMLTLAAILQATLIPQIRLLGGGPDLVYLIVLTWAINAKLESGVLWAFIGGIIVDLLSNTPTGTTTFGMLLTVFAISGLGQQVYRIGPVLLIGLVIFGTLVQQLVMMTVLTFTGFRVDWVLSLGYVVAPTILYNLALVWPVYWLVRRLQRGLAQRGAQSVRE